MTYKNKIDNFTKIIIFNDSEFSRVKFLKLDYIFCNPNF